MYNNYNVLKGSEEYTRLDVNNEEGVFAAAHQVTSFFVYTESRVWCRVGTGAVEEVMATDDVLEVYQGVRLDGRWTTAGDDGAPLAFQGAFV